MKFSGTTVTTLFTVISPSILAATGYGGDNHVGFDALSNRGNARIVLRQVRETASASGSGIRSSEMTAPQTSSAQAAGSETATATASFSLHSINPTAIPLSAINTDEHATSTRQLKHTAAPGATPTFIPDAPALPNAALLKPTDYPPLDQVPPVDSEQVKMWVEEVKKTGVVIPGLEPSQPGGCSNNSAFAMDSDRCWWTCGGCTRPTDIVECPAAMDWGLTYDDGPSLYSSDLLAYLDEVKIKSTFFVVGSRVISHPDILQAEYMAGHQIAVHTWSHASLTTLTNEEIIAELGWTKKVIKDVLGVTPNMMRPPTGDIDDRVRAISQAMGLTPVMWSRASDTSLFDTDDFNIRSGKTTAHEVLQNWGAIMKNATSRSSGFIVLAHDLFEQTVQMATGYILPDALSHQPPFNIQPIISCQEKEMKDAYLETAGSEKNSPIISEAISSGEVTLTGSANSAKKTEESKASSASFITLNIGVWLLLVVTVLMTV
ncbi:Chitin deacetylase [Psilocybe cubensis]|uniref:Chitin deacetylase n=2 Tax=Psilocybe cubensis TaxID=181762 RepID=A0ACB8GHN0_PSICU|nr:Chitin deacetylase [Psilocybe cubensis]KAH9475004.1 Chitin deacetylase [Psilocybe cubensis]